MGGVEGKVSVKFFNCKLGQVETNRQVRRLFLFPRSYVSFFNALSLAAIVLYKNRDVYSCIFFIYISRVFRGWTYENIARNVNYVSVGIGRNIMVWMAIESVPR